VLWRLWLRFAVKAEVGVNDDAATILRKCLRGRDPAERKPQVTVEFSDARKYVGSLYYRAPGGGITLLGWCKIPRANLGDKLDRRMQALEDAGKFDELLELAQKNRFPLEWDGVAELKNGELVYTDAAFKKWENLGVMPSIEPGTAENYPVRLTGEAPA
jgi:hypothetical protein